MKYKIEKNTVQETLIIPLYSRKLCTGLYPNLYRDETAVHLLEDVYKRQSMQRSNTIDRTSWLKVWVAHLLSGMVFDPKAQK